MTENVWLSLEEAAKRLGIPKKIAASLCEEGQLVGAEKKGSKWEVPVKSTILFERRRQTMMLVPKKKLVQVKLHLLTYLSITGKETIAISDDLLRMETETIRNDYVRNHITELTDKLERKQRLFALVLEAIEWLSKIMV